MHPPRLLLIRHGQTAWNITRRFLGRTDVPLDATGEAQAERLGRRFAETPPSRLWSSPLLRARQTAERLGEPRLEPGLVEMDMGEVEGLDGPTFAARYPDLFREWRDASHTVQLPGAEPVVDVQARALAALGRIAAQAQPGETVAVVTHQLVLATVVCHCMGEPLAKFRSFMHRNTGITTVEYGEFPRVVTFDDAGHLED